MTNTFFNHDTPLTKNTAYRAANVNAVLEAVELGFDRIPAKDPLNHGYHDYLVDSGAADAYVVAFASNAPTAYANGMSFKMKAANANTGASTINVNSIGVKNLTDINGSPLVEGDITTGAILHIAYDGSSFRIIGGRCSTATEFNSAILTKQRTVKSITDLLAIDGGSITNGESAVVNSFYASGTTGGGLFIWNSSLAKSNHNGGTIISPTVPWDGATGTLSAFLAGTGETDSGGNGCWVRPHGELDVLFFGADPTGTNTSRPAIQAAIDLASANYGMVLIPAGEYAIDAAITMKSNVRAKGHGAELVISSASSFSVFYQSSTELENVEFYGLVFDGALNYPADSTVYKQTYALVNNAIRTSGPKITGLTISGCTFKNISGAAIDINGSGSSLIKIDGNLFDKGSYITSPIVLRIPDSPFTDDDRVKHFSITRNFLKVSGPQQHYDASKEDWTFSSDGISIDSGSDGVISGNIVYRPSSFGIRVEQCVRVSVHDNIVIEPGADGITFYYDSTDCACIGNAIYRHGRIPPAYCMRSYGGSYYIPRESPHVTLATLPADPSASSWFDEWPYVLTGIDTGTIIAYDSGDYYAGPSDGILPYRGSSGISITSAAKRISISGNTIKGDVTQSGGKYVYACEYGISPVHIVNDPATDSGEDCNVCGNVIDSVISSTIYWPVYVDPINTRGLLGRATFIANTEDSQVIGNPLLRLDETGFSLPSDARLEAYDERVETLGITLGSGSATLDYTQVAVTKVGRLVTLSGELRIGTVSTPGGDVTITGLPFANSSLAGRASIVNFRATGASFTGSPQGIIAGSLLAGASSIVLYLEKDFVFTSLGAHLQVGTTIDLYFSYHAAE